MTLRLTLLLVATFALASVPCLERSSAHSNQTPNTKRVSPTPTNKLNSISSHLPLAFEPANTNHFLSRGPNFEVALAPASASLFLKNSHLISRVVLTLKGANQSASGNGNDQLTERRNYLIGNDRQKWRTNVATYQAVTYKGVYQGIDLTYYGNQRQLEYDFIVAPHANPALIRWSYSPTQRACLDANGDVVVKTKSGEVRQQKPFVYQDVDGARKQVDSHFLLHNNNEVSFWLGDYNPNKPLVIDPTFIFSTYFGGSGDDIGSSIAVDQNNNIYIAGTTSSTNFPTHGPAFGTNAGLSDIFVTKLDPTGSNVIYSTYIGGSGADRGDGITIDANGNAYVVGRADPSSTNFPTTPGVVGPTYRGGDFDGVVVKLNPQGNALVYSTFLGAEENDSSEGVAVDAAGNAYVTGGTKSLGFPTTVNAFQGTRAGDTDAYLTKLNPTASAFLYSTYLGGSGTDRGSGVAIDAAGNAYVAGFTNAADFPTESAFQSTFGGSFDAFVAKFDTNSSGVSSLLLCSYLGGTGDDKAYGIALENGGANFYVVGQAGSSDFPLLEPAQAVFGGSFDAFVAKISSSGTKVYTTYLGGSGDDRGTGVAVNSSGAAYVTGFTSSTNFPVVNPLQLNKAGAADAFVAKLNPAGSAFLYSTYLGGTANENVAATVNATNPIAVDASSNAYLIGYTASTNFPTNSPLQNSNAGLNDAFIVKLSDSTPAADFSMTAAPSTQTVNPGNSTNYTITVTPASGFLGTVALSATGLPANTTSSFNPTSITITDANPASTTLTLNTSATTPAGTYTLNVTGTSGNLQHTTSPTLTAAGATSANLSITKTASPNPAIVGTNLTYRIVVSNAGPSPATNATITDTLPAGVNFVSATTAQGTCTGTTTVTCNLGTIPSGSFAIANIIIVPQATGQLSNTASVTATESDPNPADNSVTVLTNVTTQLSGPSMLDPNLSVHTVVTGLSQPTSLAFVGINDFFVLEKDTGKVKRVINGAVQSTVLDLAVNSASERGLLGIALHPAFKKNGYVYLYWTESSTGVDSAQLADVPLLGNRLDRYIWNGTTLTFDRNIIKLRSYQADANQPLRGNHNGGVVRFGYDGKLYLLMGDNGRRGLLQNATNGQVPDDQYGGPDPDNAHLTGVILRFNDDGTTPVDNPFFNATTSFTGEAAANIKKIYAYGVRNSFGMQFDPLSGNLWTEENGDDCCDEINHVVPGFNGGWVQIIGLLSRIADYKQIETTYGTRDLQQLRWSPTLIADTPQQALSRLFMLPGAVYTDPEFSWKYAVAPSTIGFVQGRGIGPQFEGDLFVGASRTFLSGGYLFRLRFSADRQHLSFTDPRLADKVADNADKFDVTESESLLIGKDFGITTAIETAPNGNLFVVSNSNSAVYEITGNQPTVYVAGLNGAQEVPSNNSTANGTATLLLSPDETTARLSLTFNGITSETAAHIHGPAAPGVIAPLLFTLPQGNVSEFVISLTASDVQSLKNGQLYIDVHSTAVPTGEIRGQFGTSATASSVQFNTSTYSTSESSQEAVLTLTRIGDTTNSATVSYQTVDDPNVVRCDVLNGIASARCDYTTTFNTVTFAAGEKLKTISIPVIDDAFAEGNETFNVALRNAVGATLGPSTSATVTIRDNDAMNSTVNPILSTPFFVRQHYLDFLSREPEAGEPWSAVLNNCPNVANDPSCDRITVSAAFVGSPEFQLKGYFIYRFYKLAFNRLPTFSEISADMSSVTGQTPAEVFQKKAQFTNAFVLRPEFVSTYSALTNSQYVSMLMTRYNLTQITTPDPANPDGTNKVTLTTTDLINQLTANTLTRAQVLRAIADSDQVISLESNQAFVAMQYYGYLRRTPETAGYNAWLAYLNSHPGDYRTMVDGFMNSAEYKLRFGP